MIISYYFWFSAYIIASLDVQKKAHNHADIRYGGYTRCI